MKKFDSINVIPLIDVMLVLLAIVLTTASFIVHDALKLDLPDTQSTSSYQPTNDPTKHLAIDAKGTLFLEDKPISYANFKALAAKIDPKTDIVIKVDRHTVFGKVVALVDILKANKLNKLTFLTDKATTPES
ncbi:ExbD/TolR family protein [Hydrogenovibrio kuenenii]|uniref:ExbD/TolR family protein n=1 Tax=Hydrogenovibrio kuenenii TaxID=63658 RepID=UPI000467B0DD|nr:biopolymer transporter ExbD [Hydrogenovibrio kuenenii]